MSSILSWGNIFGIEDSNKKQDGYEEKARRGDYRDILPAHTQVETNYGKTFVSHAVRREYESTSGMTKDCPSCGNNSLTRRYCSTCHGEGKVPLYFGVY